MLQLFSKCAGFLLALGLGCGALVAVGAEPSPDFEKEVAPILVKRCLECHNARDANGQLVLTTADRLARGGDGGEVVLAGDPEASPLWQRVHSGEMPPPRRGQSQQLPPAEQEVLKRWIAAGATWPAGRTLDLFEATTDVRGGRDFWSLLPVMKPEVPRSDLAPIDAFIREKLERAQLEPAPAADRRTLIRRVFNDLIGLPPTHAEIEAFAADASPRAYEHLVDELLARPQFGERWARHWLDVVRYAETCGYERDQVKPFAWKYRDWVVRAFNSDLPWDRFVLEQLAGDELPDRTPDTVVATGFLRLGTWNDEPNDPQEYKYERLEDLVHATSSAFLAYSVKCARCHDHKFDPISQEDYYRFANAFWPGAIEPRDGKLLGGPSAEELGTSDVLGWTDVRRTPPPLHLFRKGDPKQPLGVVEPGQLSMVSELANLWEPVDEHTPTTRRRWQLARWIVDRRNPLTARVVVNRLWQHHFGHGLVTSPNDFGFNGARPTHPELLDWLAADLVEGGWTLKRMHRQMVLSETYRQASVHPRQQEYAGRDASNSLWWRAERRRRDAEGLRDAMLAVEGALDLTVGGPSFKPTIAAEALEGLSRKAGAWQASPKGDQNRRSLYIFTQRSLLPPLMTVFDFSDTTLPCAQRDVTTVAPQALALLNNEFVHDRSQALARRVTAAGGDRPEMVRLAWRLTLGREATEREVAAGLAHWNQQATALEQRAAETPPEEPATDLPIRPGLTLHLRADRRVQTTPEGLVTNWGDTSGQEHHATAPALEAAPLWKPEGLGGRPAIQFAGERQFFHLAGRVVSGGETTIFAVATDRGAETHREILSNWNGAAGNSTTSLFVGTTGKGRVRVSDDFATAGEVQEPTQPFVLTVSLGSLGVGVWQNGRELERRSTNVSPRNLGTAWVVGQQGNIQGEYWKGELAELIVFARELTTAERETVGNYLMSRYDLTSREPAPLPVDLGLASLCHVLLNTNEFLYVD
ncbi:MAG: PSD1 and planctomycete cytochrome C domain-containing protein [Planctomycetaceae bacterium]